MKLWVDDIREPPDNTWTWARTNSQAITLLLEKPCDEASLDHDMGLHYLEPHQQRRIERHIRMGRHRLGPNGLSLVRWMAAHDRIPGRVAIHSHNLPQAERMACILRDHGCQATLTPY